MTLDDVLKALRAADAAGNVEDAQKLARIAKGMVDEAKRPIPTDYTLTEAATKGFQRSAKQMGSALFDVLPAMGASALGFKDYAEGQMKEAAKTQEEIARDYPAQFKSYTEVDSPYKALQYGAETLGELGPSALGAMIPGGIAGTVGRGIATRGALAAAEAAGPLSLAGREAAATAAKKVGEEAGRRAMYGGVYLGSYAQNTPEIFQNIYEETGKFEPLVSGLAGGLSSLLDSIVPGRVMDQLGTFGKLKAVEKLAKDSGAAPSVWKAIGKEASSSALKEGLTESAQETISAAAEQIAGSAKNFLDPENIQRYKEAFVKGAVGGAGFGVVGGAGRGFAEKGAFREKQEQERIAQQEAARQAKLADEVAASEKELAAIAAAGAGPQMELPGMGLGQDYGPYSALIPPTEETAGRPESISPGLVNRVAQDLGLKVEKSAAPEETVARIREAVDTYIQTPRVPAMPAGAVLESLPAEYRRAVAFLGALDSGGIPTTKTSSKQLAMVGPQGGVTKAGQRGVSQKVTPTELENIRVGTGAGATANLFKPGTEESKALLGLDLLNPEDAARAKEVLGAYASGRSEKLKKSVLGWVAKNLDPVITPRGAPNVAGTDTTAGGAGVEAPVAGAPAGISTTPTEPPQRGGVDTPPSNVGQPAGGEVPQQGALDLEPTEPAPAQITPARKPKSAPAQITPARKPNYAAMSPEELQNLLDNAGKINLDLDVAAIRKHIGEEAAVAYEKMTPRQRDKWWSENATEALERDGSPFKGVDENAVAEYLKAHNNFDTESPKLLGRSIALIARNISKPDFIGSPEFITLWNAINYAKAQGWSEKEVLDAMRQRAKEWAGRDKEELFKELFKNAPSPSTHKPLVEQPTPKKVAKGPKAPSKKPPKGKRPVNALKPNGDPSDAEAAFVQAGLEGKTAIEAAEWLVKNSPDWDYRVIADRVATALRKLEKQGVKFSFRIAHKDNPLGIPTARGVASTTGSALTGITRVEVAVNGTDAPAGYIGVRYQTVLHELIHAVTVPTIFLTEYGTTSPEAKKLVARLDAVFNEARKQFTKRQREVKNSNGSLEFSDLEKNILNSNALNNSFEIITWGLTDRKFQKWLETIEYKGTGKSLWSAFVASIREFLGLPAKADTALAEILSISEQLIDSPISGLETFQKISGDINFSLTLNDQAARFPNLANKIVGPNGLADKGLRKIPEAVMTPAIRTDMWAALEKLTIPLRSLFYKALNASQMGEVASKYFGRDSVRFATILNEIGGYRQRIEERLEPLNRQFVAHREKFPERHAALHALMNDATIADVAPYDDAATVKKYKGTPKEATYEALKKRFNELTAEEKQMYKSGFDSFVTLRKEFQKSLKGNISELVKDEATALSIYNKIMNELSEIMIDHYFPLYRKGDFRLSYTLNGTGVVERFESQAERAAKQRELEAQGATDIEATSQLDQFNASNIPDGTMLSAVMKIVKDAGGTKEDLDKVVQLVVSAFPETSILKRQQKRTGIPGYINDNAALVFDSVTSNNARQIATIKYREELKSLMGKMLETQAGLRGDASEDARTMLEDIDGRFRFAMDPDVAGWAQTASSAAFYFNLAANVSSALVQFATLPTVVFPNLGGRYGSGKAWEALKAAKNLYQSSGFTRQVEGLDGRVTDERAMLSIENLINRGDPKAAKYAGLIEAMKDNELLTASTAHNALRAENRTDSGYGAVNKVQRWVGLYSSFMMHHTERMSREVTAVAAYDLELARLEKSKPGMKEAERQAAAIREAIRVVERTHGAVTSITGTRIGQNSIGKIFMVFKNYAFAQYYNLFSTIFRAFPVKGADPETLEDIKAARRQLVGMYGMVALFAGVKGVPLYWIAELAYNALTDDDEEDFDMVMRRYLGEFLFKGPVNYITNLSIADRVGWTDLIWRENKNDRAGSSAVVQYLESSFAPLSIIKNAEKGFEQISQGNWYRGVEAMLPAAIKNPMKALRYGSEGANTLRGDPVMADINIGNAAMQALGFAPADLMNQYEQNAEILARQKAIRGGEQKLLKQYYVALRNNDFDRASEVAEKLYELGEKYPELGIGPELLNKSVKERDRFSSKLYHGMRIDDKLRERLLGASQIGYD
jgi:hypothetical protein